MTSNTSPTTQPLLAALLLCAATLLAFSPVVGHQFLADYDDFLYVTENPMVLQGLTLETVCWAFTTTFAAFWHPLTWLSLMADVELSGMNPAGFHLTAVLLHAAAALALFFALRRLTGALARSALVAALFALHPLHVESVAWISERKDVLCALFWFLGLGAYAAYARRPGALCYAAAFAAYAAALMSKSMAVTFPFVLLLLDFWPLGRFRAAAAPGVQAGGGSFPQRRIWLEKIPFFLLIPLVAALSYKAQVGFGSVTELAYYDVRHRLANALVSYGAYVAQSLFPHGLAAYYPHPGAGVSLAAAAAGGALLVLITGACVRLVRPGPYLASGWLWYLGTLVPVIGLVQVGEFSRADRFTYVPLVGLFVALVWGAADACDRRGVRLPHRVAAAGGLLAVCAALTWLQSGYWRDEVALWTRTLAVTGENVHARMQLGLARMRRGELELAAEQFREALRIHPGFDWAMGFLAEALERAGNHEEARSWRERARALGARLEGGQPAPSAAGPAAPRPAFGPTDHNKAGVSEAGRGRLPAAEARFRNALELDPSYVEARYNLGELLRNLGRAEEAYAEFQETVRLDPGFARAYLGIGAILQERGDVPGARAAYRRALAADPGLGAARSSLEALGPSLP